MPKLGQRTDPKRTGADLAKVRYDLAQSTPFNERYEADSDSEAGKIYAVTYDTRANLWACHQCTAASFGRACRHVKRAQWLRRVRYFSALFAGQPPHVLLAELARREERVAAGYADKDDHACIDFCRMTLGEEVAA